MSGAIPPLPQYAFMAWCLVKTSTGITLPLPFYLIQITWRQRNGTFARLEVFRAAKI
jgi:hypothetical protein